MHDDDDDDDDANRSLLVPFSPLSVPLAGGDNNNGQRRRGALILTAEAGRCAGKREVMKSGRRRRSGRHSRLERPVTARHLRLVGPVTR